MHIAFVHNKWFPYSNEKVYVHSAGGAALSNLACILEGEKRGHQIDLVFAYRNNGKVSNYRKYPLQQANLAIINDLLKFQPYFLENIRDNCKYIYWSHSYNFCMSGAAKMHHELCFKKRCGNCRIEFHKSLHEKAILSVFQSPLHKEVTERILGFKVKNFFIMPAPIDTELFKPDETTIIRDPNLYLIVGSIMKHKGIEQVIELADQNPKNTYMFIGNHKNYTEELLKRKNCILRGHINNYLLPPIYNKAKYYIHLPTWWEPSSRSTMEAFLMGCELTVNDKVGTMTYDFMKEKKSREEVREIIKNAPKLFWEKIEEAYQRSQK